MENKENVRNLVILGSWNTLLFTPKWLNGNIFDGKLPDKVNTEVLIHGNSVLHRIFDLPHFKFEVSQERLCFRLKSFDDEHYQALIDAANNLFTKLPHTPLKTMGINFVFIAKEKTPFQKATNFYNLENLVQANENLIIQEVNHKIRIAINRNIDYSEFDFNYSYDLNGTASAKEILVSGIFNDKFEASIEQAIQILGKYND